MSVKRHRTAVILLLANYLLAVTVGAGLHVHGDRGCHRADAGCPYPAARGPTESPHAHASPCDCARAGHDDAATALGADWRHAGECPVCRFLAQKPIPSDRVEHVACIGVVAELMPAVAIRAAVPVRSPHPIRGPPSVA